MGEKFFVNTFEHLALRKKKCWHSLQDELVLKYTSKLLNELTRHSCFMTVLKNDGKVSYLLKVMYFVLEILIYRTCLKQKL